MTYSKGLVKQWAEEIINKAKQSTTCSYIIRYGDVDRFDPTDRDCQRDVTEWLWDYTNINDNLHAVEFNNKNQLICVIWYEPPMKENELETTKYKEETKMKKYELKDYKEFCREALVCPPFEEFDNGTFCEDDWYEDHYIKISTGNHEINIGYGADEVNEIEFALREIYEAVIGDGEATTGNTFGSQYRPAELKDIVRHFIMCRYENYGGLNWFDYAKQAVVELSDIQSVIGLYEHAKKIEKDIEFKCNWHDFKLESLKDATEEGVKKIILDLVGSDLEISYDPHTDKSFIIDYTFKDSGDFIDWAWGNINEDEKRVLLESYKTQIFEEVK
jgi:hypothetical protein